MFYLTQYIQCVIISTNNQYIKYVTCQIKYKPYTVFMYFYGSRGITSH